MKDNQLSVIERQVKEGYKQTAIGVIPEDWQQKLLGDIFHLRNGFSFKSEHFSASGPIVLTPGNFKLEGGLYFNDRNTKRYSGSFPESMVFQNGDLLVVMTDLTPDCNLLGKPAFVNSEEITLHNQRIGRINIVDKNVDKFFLYYMLLSRAYLKIIKEKATGSTVRHTSNKSIYGIHLLIPKRLEEQRAIAQVLSDVDALIAALDKLIAKKRNIKTATMQQLLTGKKRLPGFGEGKGYKKTEVGMTPEDWDIQRFGEIAKLERGKFTARPRNDPQFFGGDIPFIQTGDITQSSGYVTFYSQTLNEKGLSVSKLFPRNTLFFTIAANIGDLGIVSFETACPDSLVAILPNVGIDKTWLLQSLKIRKAEFKGLATQNAQLNINLEKLNPYLLPVPAILEQKAIAQVLSDMDAEIAALEKRRAKTQAIKQGMMQELLTGKTRLKME